MAEQKAVNTVKREYRQLDPAPYKGLIEHADAQAWRNAFGLIQVRLRELEKRTVELDEKCCRLENDLIDAQLMVDNMYKKNEQCYTVLVGSGLISEESASEVIEEEGDGD